MSSSVDQTGVNRRDFLKAGAVGGAAVIGGAVRCGPGAEPEVQDAAAQPALPAPLDVAAFELEEATIAGLASDIESGRLTARGITEAYLQRIDAVDRQGPMLRSVIEVNPDALAIAETLDRERAAGAPRGPLDGVTVLLKDNIDTADRMTTTAGSLALAGSTPVEDSFVAARLRAAGAVVLGKANLSEWANFRSSRSSSGWSARGGQCRNPYALDRNPCGSSAGPGASVSANLSTVAIGTETDGSIICPSNACGLVGIKPTLGLVSRAGIIPIAHSQDTAGPMARTVADAATMLGVLAGSDPRDPATEAADRLGLRDYSPFLETDGLEGARIGVARGFFGYHEQVDRVAAGSVEALRDAGATIVDPVALTPRPAMGQAELEVLLYEFKAGLNAYLAARPDAAVRSLADLIAFNEANTADEMPYFLQERFLSAQRKGPLTDPVYREALATSKRLAGPEGIDAVMDEHQLDAIVAPSGGPAWVTDLVNGDHFGGASYSFAAIAGYPNITVPSGFIFGLPVGLSFFGRAWSEPTLIRVAYAFEQATRQRRPPRFLPTAEVEA